MGDEDKDHTLDHTKTKNVRRRKIMGDEDKYHTLGHTKNEKQLRHATFAGAVRYCVFVWT